MGQTGQKVNTGGQTRAAVKKSSQRHSQSSFIRKQTINRKDRKMKWETRYTGIHGPLWPHTSRDLSMRSAILSWTPVQLWRQRHLKATDIRRTSFHLWHEHKSKPMFHKKSGEVKLIWDLSCSSLPRDPIGVTVSLCWRMSGTTSSLFSSLSGRCFTRCLLSFCFVVASTWCCCCSADGWGDSVRQRWARDTCRCSWAWRLTLKDDRVQLMEGWMFLDVASAFFQPSVRTDYSSPPPSPPAFWWQMSVLQKVCAFQTVWSL